MADVVAFFRKMLTLNLILKKVFFFKQIDLLINIKKFIVIAPSITQILIIRLRCALENCAKYEFFVKR